MKKILISLALILSSMTMQAATKIDHIEPENWYVGMKNSSLQLMVYGKNIRDSRVSVDYPGVKIDSLVRLDSPNYLFVYLNLSGAKPGNMVLNIDGKKVNYPLKARTMSGDKRIGFDNSDVLYMLMPDRFASGRNITKPMKGLNPYVVDRSKPSLRHGGDLEGVRQHLDYFNQLGVTALWFTPVLENNSPDMNSQSTYHGYATTNYYRVDPRFGTNEDYARLVAEAHAKGLKVVMDMIFNHCGYDHPWVKDMPSKDWFNTPEWMKKGDSYYLQTSYKLTPVLDPYASKVDKRETVDGWFVRSMPDLNQKNPHVMTYLIQNSEWWIETVGIDGIRMDTYPYADRKAMSQWMKILNEEYPNFNTVGETWVTEPAYTAAWQKDSKLSKVNSYLKTVMDFSFYDKINLAKHEETDAWWKGLNRIYNSLCYDYLYENPSSVMAFIENHDTDRFLENGKDTLALKQALALLLTINRIPQLYYGTEVLMNGTKEVTDGNVRCDFPGGFAGDKHNAFTAEGRTKAENSMFNWLSKLLKWRRNNMVITKGKQIQFIPYKGVYVIARQWNDQTILTILNGTSQAVTLPLDRYAEVIGNHQEAKDVISGRKVKLGSELQLKARDTKVIELSM
ncbi:glycoside hydrolase family 13 protein [Prevotella salivae]|uniref:Glycoside hydrolase family 13 protein n=1 Tax=Segatella salivae TaxID=228604 RepID=A0AAW4NT51_9BACT|nr:glycoside hydrolase family 13 protein [Segatella salivae]MBW4866413.1 glycoside hydrolase family 13 protein [Segatella salivae]MBW4910279.1 glycoside hydrolase family 13 protein [Segatella salivae]